MAWSEPVRCGEKTGRRVGNHWWEQVEQGRGLAMKACGLNLPDRCCVLFALVRRVFFWSSSPRGDHWLTYGSHHTSVPAIAELPSRPYTFDSFYRWRYRLGCRRAWPWSAKS
jgi:hypothetical protein